jgi:hypothetical protein
MLSDVQDEAGFCCDGNPLRRVAMKRALLAIPALLLLASTRSDTQKPRDPIVASVLMLTSTPVQLDQQQPGRTRLGKLVWLGGWALASDHRYFGGLSALDARSGEFIALSDVGAIVRFRQEPDGRFVGRSLAPLPKGCSRNNQKADQDSESLARRTPDGEVWAGIESVNMICKFDATLARTIAARKPTSMQQWPRTGGTEGVTWLRDGRFAAFAEQAVDDGPLTPVAVFAGDPTQPGTPVQTMAFRAPKGFRPCDAATLPDGRILVLNRRFAFPYHFSAILVIVDPAQLKASAIIEGKEIARFVPPVITDNLEAIAIESTTDGPIIWIASDDNFSGLQQNVLLKFKFEG